MKIKVTDLEALAQIGVGEEERSRPQRLWVSFELTLPPKKRGQNDEIENTICYDHLVTLVEDFVRNSQLRLLEKLCLDLHDLIQQHSEAEFVKVQIAKASPPVQVKVKRIEVEYETPSLPRSR